MTMPTPATQRKIVPFIVALSIFMEALDATIINTAIPSMSQALQVDAVDLKVALISYLLSLAIFIPISGWLADKFGSKTIFTSALLIFTFSSLACGFAQDLSQLVIARFVQGVGGALGLPVGRLIIARMFERKHLIHVMGQVIMVGSLGMMLGPAVGGVITQHFSWQWIFWINIPVGIFSIFIARYWLTYEKPQPVPPLDKIGFVLFGASLSGFAFGLSALSETTIDIRLACLILLLSGLMLFFYIKHSRNQPHPIVKTHLLQLKTFKISVVGNLLSRVGFGGIPFLVPLLLQIGLGYSAQISGILLSPVALGVLLAKPFALPVLRKWGYKRVLFVNTFLAGMTMWCFMSVNPHTPLYSIGLITFMYGFIVSIQYTAMNSLAYAEIPSENLSAATSIMGTLQQLALSSGVAVSAVLIRIFSRDLVLTPQVFQSTFFTIGVITLLSSFIFMQLRPDDGEHMLNKD